MSSDELAAWERVIGSGDPARAEQFCSAMLGRADGEAWAFWKTQAGYACFLNEADDDARYDRAPAHFQELARRRPTDVNAWFWLGYLDDVLFCAPSAGERLRSALALAPEHPYASLALAGMNSAAESGIPLLQTVVRVQGNNVRATRELARLWMEQGDAARAERALRMLVSQPPFVERGYGIINGYMNGVLTGATHHPEWKDEAERTLASLR